MDTGVHQGVRMFMKNHCRHDGFRCESERVSDSGGKTTAGGLNSVVGRAGSTSQRADVIARSPWTTKQSQHSPCVCSRHPAAITGHGSSPKVIVFVGADPCVCPARHPERDAGSRLY